MFYFVYLCTGTTYAYFHLSGYLPDFNVVSVYSFKILKHTMFATDGKYNRIEKTKRKSCIHE